MGDAVAKITDKKRQESVWDNATDYERAEIAVVLRERDQIDDVKKYIEKLTAENQDKVRKEIAKFISQKSVADIERTVEKLPTIELDHLVQSGDMDKIANILSATTNIEVAKAIRESITKQGLTNKYEVKLKPSVVIEKMKGVAPGTDDYRREWKNIVTKMNQQEIAKAVTANDINEALQNATGGMLATIANISVSHMENIQKTLRDEYATGKYKDVAEILQIKFNNKELADQFRNPTGPSKMIIDAIIGEVNQKQAQPKSSLKPEDFTT